jgi:hypothetical protein
MIRSATITRKRTLVIWTVAVMSVAFLVATARAAAITYDVEFTDYAGGPTLQWLDKKGYKPERDADNSKKVVVSHTGKALSLATRKQAAGLLLSQVQIHTYSTIRITWGVNAFPPGASYAKGVRSEAIMVYVFFGTEKISSGHFLVPDSPYFIGLYLCDSDPVGQAFTGRYFKAGGRYVCIDRATTGKEVVTDYAIADAFKQFFGQNQPPPISGVGVGIDTENAKGNGVAKSFISEIEFLK